MRVDDGGGYVAPPPPKPVKPAAPAATPTDPGMRQGSASTTQWPGGPDAIDYKGIKGPELRMLKQEAQEDYNSGTFNSGSYPQSAQDQRITNGLASEVSRKVGQGQPLSQNDTYYLNQYVAGKMPGQDKTDAPQRLQNVMASLGPQASAAWLQRMSDGDYKNLGIQNSFNSLASSGKLTPADARELAGADMQNNLGTNPDFTPSTVGSLVAGLPNDDNSNAFKNAYAHQCINNAEQLTTGLNTGAFHGEIVNQAKTQRTLLYGQATAALDATPNDDSAKRAAFTQMTADASAIAGKDQSTADKINAFAADTLGGASPEAVAKQFESMGGVGANNQIAPDSKLGKFLSSAIAGQADLGSGSLDSFYTGMNAPPNGVSRLLGSLSQGADNNLTQATLSSVLETFIAHPDQASALQKQDAAYGTGLQKSMSDALSSGFDAYLTRNGKAGIDSTQAKELSVLSSLENGPPFETGAAKNFESVIQNKASQYSSFALSKEPNPWMASYFDNDPNAKQGALEVSASLMQSYLAGAGAEQSTLVARANGVTSPNQLSSTLSKVQDFTTVFAAIPGDVPGQGLAAGVATVAGVVGALQDVGIISNDPSSGAKKANAQLAAADDRSGVDGGVKSMAQAYAQLEDASHNAAISNDPYFGTGSAKTLVNGNDQAITAFTSKDDAPVVPAY